MKNPCTGDQPRDSHFLSRLLFATQLTLLFAAVANGQVLERSGDWTVKGGKTSLDLMPSESVTAACDRDSLLPGVNWRLDLKNTRVERWSLFLRRIGGWQDPFEVSLGESKDVIVSLFPHNLKGDVVLTNNLSEPLKIGNVTFKRAEKTKDKPAGISMYALYLFGDETDATIRGKILVQKTAAADPSSLAKPKVWIYTDMSDPTLKGTNHRGTVNDPDDVSAMAGYLLMANEFETLGIVVASTHRDEHRNTPDQAEWANRFFGDAYRKDVKQLNERFGGYPANITFVQSCIKETAERFSKSQDYRSLDDYPSVGALLDKAKALKDGERINVLCWGSLTEPAILVSHCLATNQTGILKRLRFIAHWTNSSLHQGTKEHPERVANCREDAMACAYMKHQAQSGSITFHECGAIGQHGIVSGSPQGDEYFDQFRTSRLGTIFVEGKYVRGRVDHSDSATFWTLLGKWGVSLKDIPSDGSNNPSIELRNEEALRESSSQIHDELLKRSGR